MIKWLAVLGLVGAAGALMKWYVSPVKVEISPPGAVIFNPAPSTGSSTFLGDITGDPANKYWNITTQINDIPSGFYNPNLQQSSLPTVLTNVMSSK